MKKGKYRTDIAIGDVVEIVEKQNQSNGNVTEGLVKRILTNSAFHPHGIKVKLDTGEVGRVQHVIEED